MYRQDKTAEAGRRLKKSKSQCIRHLATPVIDAATKCRSSKAPERIAALVTSARPDTIPTLIKGSANSTGQLAPGG